MVSVASEITPPTTGTAPDMGFPFRVPIAGNTARYRKIMR